MKKTLFLVALTAMILGCASTPVAPIRSDAPSSFQIEDDEQRLWRRSQEEQKVLDKSDLLFEEVELVRYINDVADKLQPALVREQIPFRVAIIKNPLLNAFAYPNGVIYVHSGILARMESEAELATLLSHEMTHVTHRHTLQKMRDMKNKAALMSTINVFAVGLGGGLGNIASLLGQLGAIASVQGYSRELETEADTEGFGYVVAAKYDPAETAKLFKRLKEDVEDRKEKEPFFFGSHPKLQERIDNYEKLQALHSGGGGVKNADIFSHKIMPIMLVDAELNIRAGNFRIAQREAERYLSLQSGDARAHFILGEVFRQRNEQGDMDKAIAAFRESIGRNPSYANSYKSLGLIYLKQGEKSQAKEHLQRYLMLSPQVHDRAYIVEYIKQCE